MFSARLKQQDSQEGHPDCTPGLLLLHLPTLISLWVNATTDTAGLCCPTSQSYSRDICTESVLSVPLHSPGNKIKTVRVTHLTHFAAGCTGKGSPAAIRQLRCLALVDRAPQHCSHSLRVRALTWSWTGPVHRPRPACSSSWAGHRPRQACCSRGRTGPALAFFYWSCWFPAGCCSCCRCSGG